MPFLISRKFQKGHRFFIKYFFNKPDLSGAADASKGPAFLLLKKGTSPEQSKNPEGRNHYEPRFKKGTGIEPLRRKKKVYPERRRYATPPTQTERKICSRSEKCIGCPFPATGFICWGKEDDCLRTRYMKLQNKENQK